MTGVSHNMHLIKMTLNLGHANYVYALQYGGVL